MDKVFIIVGSSGSWEDARIWNHCVYESEQVANEELLKLNEKLKVAQDLNKMKIDKCNNCDKCEDEELSDEEYDICDGCEFEYSYNLEEQRFYTLETIDWIREED